MFKVVIDMKCNLVTESDTILNNPIPFKKKKKREDIFTSNMIFPHPTNQKSGCVFQNQFTNNIALI